MSQYSNLCVFCWLSMWVLVYLVRLCSHSTPWIWVYYRGVSHFHSRTGSGRHQTGSGVQGTLCSCMCLVLGSPGRTDHMPGRLAHHFWSLSPGATDKFVKHSSVFMTYRAALPDYEQQTNKLCTACNTEAVCHLWSSIETYETLWVTDATHELEAFVTGLTGQSALIWKKRENSLQKTVWRVCWSGVSKWKAHQKEDQKFVMAWHLPLQYWDITLCGAFSAWSSFSVCPSIICQLSTVLSNKKGFLKKSSK